MINVNLSVLLDFLSFLCSHILIYLQAIIITLTLISIALVVIFLGFNDGKDGKVIDKREIPKDVAQEEDNEERKLFLITKFNTYVNKIMPKEIESFVKKTYDKIYGRDSKKFYPKISPRAKQEKSKKTRVSFIEQTIDYII